jgi:hypothetical protein
MRFAEFERIPDEPGKDELLEGEHRHAPPAYIRETGVFHRLFALLMRIVDGEKPRRVWVATGYKIGDDTWLRPDVSVTHEDEGAPLIRGLPRSALTYRSFSPSPA